MCPTPEEQYIQEKLRVFQEMESWIPGVKIVQRTAPFKNLFICNKGLQLFGFTSSSFFLCLPQKEFKKLVFDEHDSNTCFLGATEDLNGQTEKKYYIRESGIDDGIRIDLIICHHLLSDTDDRPLLLMIQLIPFHLMPGIQKKVRRLVGELAFKNQHQRRMDLLTHRQKEVLQLMSQLKPAKQIATEMGIGVETVNSHKTIIKDILELESNLELIFYGLAFDYIPNSPDDP